MADDPLPTDEVAATSVGFRGVAQTAGNILRQKLSDLNLTSNDSDLAWSDINRYEESLEAVMEQFRKYVSIINKRCTNKAVCSLYSLPGVQETTP